MHTFEDSTGREWRLSLNFRTLERLRDAGCDLTDPQTVIRLGDDPYRLGAALWALVEEQAGESISPEIFAQSMASGEAIEAAVSALLDELILFTRPARRPALEQAFEKKQKLEAMALEAATGLLGSGQMERRLERVMATFLGDEASGT